jgi:hypothetical protein
MSDEWTPDEIDAHQRVWKSLFDRASAALDAFGRKGYRDADDYWIVDDDLGWDVLQVELQDAILLRRDLVHALQALLVDYPAWIITLNVGLRGRKDAPGMGLLIYPDRIVDDLKREYLPEQFRHMRFE